jgi:c-di-GMP-binding flagellar brake protein YcgR
LQSTASLRLTGKNLVPFVANSPSGQERKRHLRIKTSVPVEFKTAADSPPLRASSAEISLGGCYIESMFTLGLGTKVSMTLWLKEQPVRTNAVGATRHLQVGNGFEFIDMSTQDRLKLSQFVEALPTDNAP